MKSRNESDKQLNARRRKSLHEKLDEIWNYAAINMPCDCGNDDKWEQDIRGDILCPVCNWTLSIDKLTI